MIPPGNRGCSLLHPCGIIMNNVDPVYEVEIGHERVHMRVQERDGNGIPGQSPLTFFTGANRTNY
jgi:hypothetical protein